MAYKHYIQVGDLPSRDLETDFNIIVKKVEGLTELPDIKKPFSKDWVDEQGIDVYIPDEIRFKSREVKITFILYGNKETNTDIKQSLRDFFDYLLAANHFSYFDTYRKTGFRGYYSKQKMNEEKYREYLNYIEFETTFVVPNGICRGFNNEGETYARIEVRKGTANFYFSDGTSILNMEEGMLNVTLNGGFYITCPSLWDGAGARKSKPFGIFVGEMPLGIEAGEKPIGY